MANGMDPAGLLIMSGLAKIVTGIIYRLPMSIELKKLWDSPVFNMAVGF